MLMFAKPFHVQLVNDVDVLSMSVTMTLEGHIDILLMIVNMTLVGHTSYPRERRLIVVFDQ